jgi:hypothetical protein
MTTSLKHFVAVAVALIAAALALTVSSPASAGLLPIFCPGTTSTPFLRWLDPLQYTLAPGGDFEGRTAWALTGGAKVVSGNEPFRVTRSTDTRSLSVPAGASALTPPVCVGLLDPTLRFFAVGGNSSSSLRVDVVYKTILGTVTQRVASVGTAKAWGPTPPYLFLANITGLLSLNGLTSSVQFRFTATGSAGWQIDDVYVDPFKIH